MKIRLLLMMGVAGVAMAACGSEKPVDDNKPAPPPTYTMVPSQHSAGAGSR